MSFTKIDIEFCLTDNSVNCYGYRLLTEGLQLDRFSPSIGYLMHKREDGVAVKWEDFRIEGDKLYAKPVVNTAKFPDLAGQIEAGFYNAASVGHIVALELSDSKELKLPNQKGPTGVKWFPREISIVDIPGNFNAVGLSKLYDEQDGVLQDLTDINKPQTNMDKLILSAGTLALLNLSADAPANLIDEAIANLAAKAAKHDAAEARAQAVEAERTKERVAAIIDKGLTDRKLTKELGDTLAKDYSNNPDGLKALVDTLPVQTLVTANLGGEPANLPERYKGKTIDELFVSNELPALKADFPEYYEFLKTKK